MKRAKTILLFLLFFSCASPEMHPSVSKDMKDSKHRNVFIAEYRCTSNPYRINDTLRVTVKEAWLEQSWYYHSNENETLTKGNDNEFRLCVNSVERELKGITVDWTIGSDPSMFLRLTSKSSLTADLAKMPGDTIIFPVQQGNSLDKADRVIIGQFVLVKK